MKMISATMARTTRTVCRLITILVTLRCQLPALAASAAWRAEIIAWTWAALAVTSQALMFGTFSEAKPGTNPCPESATGLAAGASAGESAGLAWLPGSTATGAGA